jgi:glycosyltransferase involved in cell wall biosynthesis
VTVAQIVRSLEVGGGEMLAAQLAERLDRRRFRPVLFCLQEAGWLARELEGRGVRVVCFGAGEGAKPGLVGRLCRALRVERVEVAHCHNRMPLLYAGLAAVAVRTPALVMTKHGMTFWRGWRQAPLARFVLRRAVSVAVSDEVHSAIVAGGWAPAARVRTILNGVDPERYCPGRGREAARRALGWTGDEFVVGIVARLAPEKDHANLVRGFAQFARATPRARLAIIGDGPLRAALEAEAAGRRLGDRCRFLGERRDVPDLLPGLDLFVLSSTREGTPLTLLEAMAAGLSAVTTAVGGMPAVVVEGETGLLVPPGEPEALASAFARLAADPEARRRMGAAGRRRVVERYSLDRMTRDYERLYLGMVRQG